MNITHTPLHARSSFWHSLFKAESVAVIGANNTVGTWGYDALRSLLLPLNEGIKRRVYAVNPNIPEIQGLKTFPTILDIPDPVELAIIVVRADIVPGILRQCVEKKVKAAVIISAGFGEVDEAGARLEAELVEIARMGNLYFVGPNCLGHADAHSKLASCGIGSRIGSGSMALLSQSGTLGASIIQNVASRGIGLSKFVGTGNEASIHLEDYLEYLAEDEDTQIITAYIEGLREGRRFFDLAREITRKKPIIVIKTGSTGESARAARSHTSALSGADAIYSAAFKQAGVIRAEDDDELCDVVVALQSQPLPRGNRVGILTMGGGFGVVTSEACEKEGLRIATLEEHTIQKMNAILPPRWSHGNPVDLVGMRATGEDTVVSTCFTLLLEDNNVDCIISLLPPFTPFPPQGVNNLSPEQIKAMRLEYQRRIENLSQQARKYGKPVFLIRRFFNVPPGEPEVSSTVIKERIPEYPSHRRAARVLHHLVWYRQYLEKRNAITV